MLLSFQRIFLVTIELFLFISFIWALVWWFRKTLTVNRWELHFIKVSGIVFVISHLAAAIFNPLPGLIIYWCGITLLLLSAALFFWSFFAFKQPPAVAFAGEIITALNTSGPYSFVRHPFYTSYLLAWFAGSLASGCYPLFASFFIMLFIYYRSAKEEEQQWLNSQEGNIYKEYRNKTGMFLPGF